MIVLVFVGLLALAAPSPEPLGPEFEPPPEVDAGRDFEYERVDSLSAGAVEVGFGLDGDSARLRRRRHLRFSADSLDGSVREGTDDDLAGSDLEGSLLGGRFGVGRVAPRWGRGLAIGNPETPWARHPGRTVYRRKPREDLVWYRSRSRRVRAGVLAGHLERRPMAGLELGVEGLRVGIAGNRAGTGIASTWWSGRRGGFELACDRSGRWRGEVSLDRHGDQGGWRILARGGSSAYRPLGDLRRVGPSRALTVAGVREGSVLGVRARTSALVSLWRFAPGLAGARVAGEWDQQLRDQARMIIGFEEQLGTRRDPRLNPTAARGAWRESDDHRRGLWLEWQSAKGPVGMGLRHEVWGRRWARDAVRRVTTARTEVELGHLLRLRLTHSVFQLERGEHVYVPEPGADRLVMRALSGRGERVRFELGCPFAQGEIRAAVHHQRGERTPAAEWTLDWTRRARVGGR